jgi:CheY-like chemotaxis protein
VQDAEPDDPKRAERADLAHELGNRLAAIVAFSHLIRTDPRLPADLHDQADLLVEEADRTRQLVERILETVVPAARPVNEPLPAAAAGPDAEPGAPRPAGTPPRILILDDEAAIRDYLARILRRMGYEPIVTADGDEALAYIRSDEPPAAILCDHRMAGMTGPAFHEAVARISPGLATRFAFMTGDVLNPDLREFSTARGITLLAKPFDIETVQRTVAGLVS